jgi:hypothetical protein
MRAFLILILAIMIAALPCIIIYLAENWRRLIWENKGRVFRVVKKKDMYYPEKRFLWFFSVRMKTSYDEYKRYRSKKAATDYIREFLQNLKEEQITRNEFIDFSHQISDPKMLLENRELETKRVDNIKLDE